MKRRVLVFTLLLSLFSPLNQDAYANEDFFYHLGHNLGWHGMVVGGAVGVGSGLVALACFFNRRATKKKIASLEKQLKYADDEDSVVLCKRLKKLNNKLRTGKAGMYSGLTAFVISAAAAVGCYFLHKNAVKNIKSGDRLFRWQWRKNDEDYLEAFRGWGTTRCRITKHISGDRSFSFSHQAAEEEAVALANIGLNIEKERDPFTKGVACPVGEYRGLGSCREKYDGGRYGGWSCALSGLTGILSLYEFFLSYLLGKDLRKLRQSLENVDVEKLQEITKEIERLDKSAKRNKLIGTLLAGTSCVLALAGLGLLGLNSWVESECSAINRVNVEKRDRHRHLMDEGIKWVTRELEFDTKSDEYTCYKKARDEAIRLSKEYRELLSKPGKKVELASLEKDIAAKENVIEDARKKIVKKYADLRKKIAGYKVGNKTVSLLNDEILVPQLKELDAKCNSILADVKSFKERVEKN